MTSPSKSLGSMLYAVIVVRVTRSERARVVKLAKKRGVTVSEHIRELVASAV